MNINQLIPPVLLDYAYKSNILKGNCSGLYSSFEQATNHLPSKGYEDEELCRSIVEKSLKFKEYIDSTGLLRGDIQLMRILLAVSLINSKNVRVLDFGGGSGYHYFLAKSYFGTDYRFDWRVIETPILSSLSKPLENDELKFYSHIDDCKDNDFKPDLLFSSGAIQYVPDPVKTIKAFAEMNAQKFFITRLPVAKIEKSIVSIQSSRIWHNGPSTPDTSFRNKKFAYYPLTLFSWKELTELFQQYFVIEAEFFEEENAYRLGDQSFDMFGYILKEK